MLEIKTKSKLSYIDVNQVIGIQVREYAYQNEEDKHYLVDIHCTYGVVLVVTTESLEEANKIAKQISDNSKNDYANGFKDGVEHILIKLKEKETNQRGV